MLLGYNLLIAVDVIKRLGGVCLASVSSTDLCLQPSPSMNPTFMQNMNRNIWEVVWWPNTTHAEEPDLRVSHTEVAQGGIHPQAANLNR